MNVHMPKFIKQHKLKLFYCSGRLLVVWQIQITLKHSMKLITFYSFLIKAVVCS